MSVAAIISTIGNKQFHWRFDDDGTVSLAGEKIPVDVTKISPNGVSILFRGRSYFIMITRNDLKYDVIVNGNIIRVGTEDSTKQLASKVLGGKNRTASDTEVRSPMPGMVVRCEVQEGTTVTPGDGLLILEAMKMENEIRASTGGVIKKMLVKEKQVVEKGELLLTIA
jgi:biotin carboxyl carrier protein